MNIEIAGMDFSYGSTNILSNINFNVKNGNIISIIGPNGSGKSTMLKCMNRLLSPNRGHILLNGKDIASLSSLTIAKRMGFVPQSEGRPFPSTVFDTVLTGRRPHMKWRPSQKDKEIVSRIIGQMGLSSLALRDIHNLSGGQRQKVYIARALAQEPTVLLLDEPTASLDLRHQIEVLNTVRKLTTRGVTTVLAIHDLNHAAAFSDQIIMLKDGLVHAAGGVDVLSKESISAVYGIDVEIIETNNKRVIYVS